MQNAKLLGFCFSPFCAPFSFNFELWTLNFALANFVRMVGPSGLEPPTSCLSGTRSNLLSYEPLWLVWTSLFTLGFSLVKERISPFLTKCQHWTIFPCSVPHSIFATAELNFCVRNGYRWTLCVCSTDSSRSSSLNIEQQSISFYFSLTVLSFVKLRNTEFLRITRSP